MFSKAQGSPKIDFSGSLLFTVWCRLTYDQYLKNIILIVITVKNNIQLFVYGATLVIFLNHLSYLIKFYVKYLSYLRTYFIIYLPMGIKGAPVEYRSSFSKVERMM